MELLNPRFIDFSNLFSPEVPTGTIDGSNMNFVLSATPASPNSVFVFLDSLKLKTDQYTVNVSTKTISLITPPSLGQDIEVWYVKAL